MGSDERNPDGGDEGFIFPGEEEPSREVRRKAIGQPVKRPKPRPPERFRPPDIREIRAGVGEIVDNTELLQIVVSRLVDLQDTVIATARQQDLHYDDDYLYLKKTVSKDNPVSINVLSRAGHAHRHGWFRKDTAEGTIKLEINGQEDIDVGGLETLNAEGLKVEDIDITTGTTQSLEFRLMLW